MDLVMKAAPEGSAMRWIYDNQIRDNEDARMLSLKSMFDRALQGGYSKGLINISQVISKIGQSYFPKSKIPKKMNCYPGTKGYSLLHLPPLDRGSGWEAASGPGHQWKSDHLGGKPHAEELRLAIQLKAMIIVLMDTWNLCQLVLDLFWILY